MYFEEGHVGVGRIQFLEVAGLRHSLPHCLLAGAFLHMALSNMKACFIQAYRPRRQQTLTAKQESNLLEPQDGSNTSPSLSWPTMSLYATNIQGVPTTQKHEFHKIGRAGEHLRVCLS